MIRDISPGESARIVDKDGLELPSFKDGLESTLNSGRSLQVEGTNVVRVPFGIREPQRKRPQRPQRWVTLVLPLQPLGSPTPPPQAA